MAGEVAAVSDMTFTDRSVGVQNHASPTIVSLKSGIACAVTFQHDLGVDMTRTQYTGVGKFCMPVTKAQLDRFRELAEALASEYDPDPSTALPNAAFDYEFSYQGEEYKGSYRYDGGEEYDRSLAPFDSLLRDIVKNGKAIASIYPSFYVSAADGNLIVDLLLENTGSVDVTLSSVSEWADERAPNLEGVTFGLLRGRDVVIVENLSPSNYSGDSSSLNSPILVEPGRTRSLRFTLPSIEKSARSLNAGDFRASGSMKVQARFEGDVTGVMDTPISPVAVQIL